MRRKTYIVETNKGSINARVYAESDIPDLMEANGYAYIRHFDPSGQKNWKLDEAALEEARAFFNLRLPVKVNTNSRVGSTGGIYRLESSPLHHKIMIKSYHSPEQASSSLWHELAHCRQAEDAIAGENAWNASSSCAPLRAWANLVQEQKAWPYKRRPIEIDARAHEPYAEALPIAVAL